MLTSLIPLAAIGWVIVTVYESVTLAPSGTMNEIEPSAVLAVSAGDKLNQITATAPGFAVVVGAETPAGAVYLMSLTAGAFGLPETVTTKLSASILAPLSRAILTGTLTVSPGVPEASVTEIMFAPATKDGESAAANNKQIALNFQLRERAMRTGRFSFRGGIFLKPASVARTRENILPWKPQ